MMTYMNLFVKLKCSHCLRESVLSPCFYAVFCNVLGEEERACCLTVTVFLMYFICKSSVARALLLCVGLKCVIVVLSSHIHLPF